MAHFEEYYNDHDYRRTNSSGVAKAGLAVGTVGASLAGLLGLGALGYGANGHPHCNEEIGMTRYDAEKEHTIMMLQTQNESLKSEKEGDRKLLELFKYFNEEVKRVDGVLSNQAVQNQATADGLKMLHGCIDREREARCCADNSIVNYVNSTFCPHEIADMLVKGDTTTTQRIYDPLPGCCNDGCGGHNSCCR